MPPGHRWGAHAVVWWHWPAQRQGWSCPNVGPKQPNGWEAGVDMALPLFTSLAESARELARLDSADRTPLTDFSWCGSAVSA
jgi:hypothetical protein